MSTINIDLADYRLRSNRAHYKCGHFADFRVGPPPDVGQWMLCATCYEDTEVERIEKHVTVTRPHGDQEPEFDDRVSILAQ